MTYWFADGGIAPHLQSIFLPAGTYKTGAAYPATRYISGTPVYFDRPLGTPLEQTGGVKLASNGSVDVGGVTRIQYPIDAHITKVWSLGAVSFANADVDKINAAPAGSYGTVSMFWAPANGLPGAPTAADIYEYSRTHPGHIVRAGNRRGNAIVGFNVGWKQPGSQFQYEYADGRDPAIMPGVDLANRPNEKFWFLVMPVLIRSRGVDANGYYVYDEPSWAADRPEFGLPDVVGRAASLWTNRTPVKPVITAPLNGAVLAGTSPLSFSLPDPDSYFGVSDPYGYDLAGIQVQYAPRPSATTPSPEWIDLPFARTDGTGLGPGFYIENSTYNGGGAPTNVAFSRSAADTLRRNRTVTMKVGSNVPTSGQPLLPAGIWQIRMRVFDYGHPATGPLGASYAKPPITGLSYTPDTYPASNKSGWSDPVTVQVAAQVPPPTPLDPIDNTAVPITRAPVLTWQYRNTVQPPNAQRGRSVRLRKVGAPDWTVLTTSIPARQYFSDVGFEKFTLDGWTYNAGGNTEAFLSTQADPGPRTGFNNFDNIYLTTGVRSGSFATANQINNFMRNFAINTGQAALDTYFMVDGWVYKPAGVASIELRVVFTTSTNAPSYRGYTKTVRAAGWQRVIIDEMIRPPDAGATHISVNVIATPVSGGNTAKFSIDDFNLWGSPGKPTPAETDVLPFYRVGTPAYQFSDDGSKRDGWNGSGGVVSTTSERVRVEVANPVNNSTLSLTRALGVASVPNGVKTVNIKGFRTNDKANSTAVASDITVELRRSGVTVAHTIKTSSGVEKGAYPPDSPWSFSLETGDINTAAFDTIIVRMVTGDGTVAILDIDSVEVILVGAEGYKFEVNNQYEWQAQTTDTSGVSSNWSTPARFWVVPGPATGVDRIVSSQKIDGATLGRGKHRVEVFKRGGRKRVGEIKNCSTIEWSRVRDDISTARIVIDNYDIDGGALLASLRCWAFEIVLFRETVYGTERVWEGPITLLTYNEGERQVVIQAKDVMAYAYRRIVKQDMDDSKTAGGDSVTSRATRVIQNAFGPSDPNCLAYLTVLSRTDDARSYRVLPAWTRTAFEEVDDMAANQGLDYTAVGRSIVFWGTRHRIGTLPELTNDDLGAPPIVSEYGMSMANVYAISNGQNAYGKATRLDANGDDVECGLIEMLSSSWASDTPPDSGTYTQAGLATMTASFEQSAERSISDRYPAPVVVRVPDNTSLNPTAVLSIQQLVPGVVIPLRSVGELRKVVGSQKLDSVRVIEVSGNESISITMSPFNRDDNAALEETDV